jgi:UDP-2,4-diacetamido-2,4,6-trideoxy-beta-L-altropyranose hydrolase
MRPMGRAVFITHGGPRIGLGHVKRCLALAKALAREGAEVAFVASPDPGVARVITSAGFDVVQRAWEGDPAAASEALGDPGADTVIVDAYTARPEHFEALRPRAGQLVAIDDTGERRLPVDAVVNVGAGTETLEYKVAPGTTLLLGPRYALLDPIYAEAPARSARARVERVLVTLGGSVHVDALRAVVAAVDEVVDRARVDVAIGPFGGTAVLDGATHPGRNHIVPYGTLPDLRSLMLEADLAVTGAGVTLYEAAATATPVVMVMTARNQQRNVAAFERARAALSAGQIAEPGLPARVRAAVARLVGDPALRTSLGAAGRRLVDGAGAHRVAEALAGLPSIRR